MLARYECSAAAADRGDALLATGSRVRGWVLVEVRGAWGQDAIHDSAFGAHVPLRWKNDLKKRQIRAVCIRQQARAEAPGVRLFACAARRPGRGAAPLWRRDVDTLVDVVPAVAELEIHRVPDTWQRVHDRLVLVCTNGKHDQCCANFGRPLVRSLRASPWAERVWECSHIGGDRFAPNVVVLPESLYFGRVTEDSVEALLTALDAGRLDLAHFRGRTAYSLAEQAVEHFVRRERGVDALDAVVVGGRGDDGAYPVIAGGDRLAVRLRRRMVTIDDPLTCRGEPGQLVPQFSLESIS